MEKVDIKSVQGPGGSWEGKNVSIVFSCLKFKCCNIWDDSDNGLVIGKDQRIPNGVLQTGRKIVGNPGSQNESLRLREKLHFQKKSLSSVWHGCLEEPGDSASNLIRCKRGHREILSLEPHVTYGDI